MRLIRYIHGSFARNGGQRVKPWRRGLYGNSWFYSARGKFYLFNTCHSWIAQGLRQAGLRLRMIDSFTSAQLMAKLEQLGAVEVGTSSNQ